MPEVHEWSVPLKRHDRKRENGMENITAREIQAKLNIGEAVVWESESPEDTAALGTLLGGAAVPGQVYTLTGDLGVGKTVFTQGFAKGLGVKGHVNSPTFTILQIYEDGRLPFYHFDVYRIADVEEMEERLRGLLLWDRSLSDRVGEPDRRDIAGEFRAGDDRKGAGERL